MNKVSRDPLLIGVSIYDSKPFNMLTSASYSFEMENGGTKSKDRWDIQHTYNRYKNGVDVSDQLQASYNTYLKSFKWWIRLFYFLLDIAIVNSYILAKIFTPDLTHLQFRLNLINELFRRYPLKKGEKRKACDEASTPVKRVCQVLPPIRLSQQSHFPVVGESKRCKICTRADRDVRSTIHCGTCLVHLCVKPGSGCWVQWHSEEFM